ncbi:hypothetical protein CAI21_17645 [Alkalilimnicola ehrlichii]|uniref:Uncharacterized protein n=1 Tax=Alkalilimnicola ehrlichii TaxID=351052 RepID=A0A3E0WH98_9GAMM|nr:hypothetical protein CAI21_17645 [Alkalilimnicola ehrlichii]RFA32350.1 hypothetical protein CAL65_19895 [Alkalilimnicola ehrlichii]
MRLSFLDKKKPNSERWQRLISSPLAAEVHEARAALCVIGKAEYEQRGLEQQQQPPHIIVLELHCA